MSLLEAHLPLIYYSMWRLAFSPTLIRNFLAKAPLDPFSNLFFSENTLKSHECWVLRSYFSRWASSPSLSIWRRKKEMSKEGLMVAKELKRVQSHPLRLERFIKSHVSRLLKSDLVSVLAEFQRQDQIFLCMKVCFIFKWILL